MNDQQLVRISEDEWSDVTDGGPELREFRVSEAQIERAVLHALLVVNDHHDGCAKDSCPVGAELRPVARKAAPRVMGRLLGIE